MSARSIARELKLPWLWVLEPSESIMSDFLVRSVLIFAEHNLLQHLRNTKVSYVLNVPTQFSITNTDLHISSSSLARWIRRYLWLLKIMLGFPFEVSASTEHELHVYGTNKHVELNAARKPTVLL